MEQGISRISKFRVKKDNLERLTEIFESNFRELSVPDSTLNQVDSEFTEVWVEWILHVPAAYLKWDLRVQVVMPVTSATLADISIWAAAGTYTYISICSNPRHVGVLLIRTAFLSWIVHPTKEAMHIKWENPTLNKQLKHADLRDNRLRVTRVNVPPSTSHTAGLDISLAVIFPTQHRDYLSTFCPANDF